MIYCFSFTHHSVHLTVRRGPNREGGDPAERRVLPKNPQPCQWGGQTDGELAGKRRTIHHSIQLRSVSTDCWLNSFRDLRWSVPLWWRACLPAPHLMSQTLKDYQRRLDTSGLKPSNELYTEYKVSQQTCCWHPHWYYHTFCIYLFMNIAMLSRTLTWLRSRCCMRALSPGESPRRRQLVCAFILHI